MYNDNVIVMTILSFNLYVTYMTLQCHCIEHINIFMHDFRDEARWVLSEREAGPGFKEPGTRPGLVVSLLH